MVVLLIQLVLIQQWLVLLFFFFKKANLRCVSHLIEYPYDEENDYGNPFVAFCCKFILESWGHRTKETKETTH
jgi:hypothetical protein